MEKEEENISHFNALTSISANGNRTSPGNKDTLLLSGEVPLADIDVKALK